MLFLGRQVKLRYYGDRMEACFRSSTYLPLLCRVQSVICKQRELRPTRRYGDRKDISYGRVEVAVVVRSPPIYLGL